MWRSLLPPPFLPTCRVEVSVPGCCAVGVVQGYEAFLKSKVLTANQFWFPKIISTDLAKKKKKGKKDTAAFGSFGVLSRGGSITA